LNCRLIDLSNKREQWSNCQMLWIGRP
jgi:hypothetical protein